MELSIVCAMGNNRVIGKNNQLPWHLPADLKHFKNLTLGKAIIMGRKTRESIGKALPGRHNIVISRQANLKFPGCDVAANIEQALELAGASEEVMIIGGANLYQQILPQANKMYLTFVDIDIDGDAFFPEWQQQEWQEVSRESHQPDEKNAYHYEFVAFDRLK